MAVHLGLFLVTLSRHMFVIGLTRIGFATIRHHLSSVAVSVAFLGWGLGGFALHFLRDRPA